MTITSGYARAVLTSLTVAAFFVVAGSSTAAAQFSPRNFNQPATTEDYHIEGAIDLWLPTAEMTIASTSLGIAGTEFRGGAGRARHRSARADGVHAAGGRARTRASRWLFGEEPEQQIREDLRRFKQLMETGEIPLSDGPGLWRAGAAGRRPRGADPRPRGGERMRGNLLDGHPQTSQVERRSRSEDPQRRATPSCKITSTAICGSDLHLYNGFIPTMKSGDILGHEFMGEVVEVGQRRQEPAGRRPRRRPVPDRVRHTAAQCERELYSLCENSNPNAWMAEKLWGYSPCGIFGYSHMLGGYAGGQAEYARVPFADVGPLKVPDDLTDEQVLFLSDIFPTGYMAAEACNIQPGDTIAVWGCGPVGQFAIKSAYLLGAERVIAIDRFPYRLRMARERAGAETINYEEVDIFEALEEMTGGRGPGSLHRRRRHGGARATASTAPTTG